MTWRITNDFLHALDNSLDAIPDYGDLDQDQRRDLVSRLAHVYEVAQRIVEWCRTSKEGHQEEFCELIEDILLDVVIVVVYKSGNISTWGIHEGWNGPEFEPPQFTDMERSFINAINSPIPAFGEEMYPARRWLCDSGQSLCEAIDQLIQEKHGSRCLAKLLMVDCLVANLYAGLLRLNLWNRINDEL